MWKRIALAAGFLIALAGIPYAAAGPLSLPVDCENGTQSGTGTFDPVTGDISITFPLSHCTRNGLDISGPIALSGKVTVQTGAVNITINYGQLTVAEDGNSLTSPGCALNLNGVYDVTTGIYDGTQSIGCVWNGSIHALLGEVVFILFM